MRYPFRYIFPGIALGAWLGATKTISDNMLMTAAEKLPELILENDLAAGMCERPSRVHMCFCAYECS